MNQSRDNSTEQPRAFGSRTGSSPPLAPAPKIYTVSELTGVIKSALRERFPYPVIVEGELSNWRVSPSGHAYFTLKDEFASLAGVMFRSALKRLAFRPANGQHVQVRGPITIYEPQGQYQIQAEAMVEVGLGALYQAFMALKERLGREGLFAPEHKRPLPPLPRRVGVVTSPSGAAIRDILNVLHRRFANVHIILAPVRVQGSEAPGEIIRAIELFNRHGLVDVMIVGRGGGSLEDLWAFNDEGVARAIFASKIPVISAVGHEIDFTIADFVADLRAPTPSAAAELVVAEQAELTQRIGELSQRLTRRALDVLRAARERLERLAASYALTQPLQRIRTWQQHVDDLTAALVRSTQFVLAARRAAWRLVSEKLDALNPEHVLARGYSLTTDDRGRLVRDAREVEIDQALNIRLHKGRLRTRVTEKSS